MTPGAKFLPVAELLAASNTLHEAIPSEFARSGAGLPSGCIFHTSHAPPYLHRGLVISLEYNRPRDRQPLVLLASLPSPSRLLSFVVPVGDVESRTGKRGMRDVCDRRETATMAEKALTASDGHICIRELLEV